MIWKIGINLIFIYQIIALPFNQPRFCPNATWDVNAITFANRSIVSTMPCGVFVNSHDSIYVANRETGEILIWENNTSIRPSKEISGSLSYKLSLFVTTNGDIYVDDGDNGRVAKWIAENNSWIPVMSFQSHCYSLFIDILHNLYCSIYNNHKVDRKWSNGTITTVAGTGSRGASSNMLNYPYGIFVDINQDLYVADYENHRIQLFRLNQRNGVTVAGNGSSDVTIDLIRPTGIVLDGDRYLFIVDKNNHRLIGSNEYGFHCIFGCSASSGSTNDKLDNPESMSFDSCGNIYVTDRDNHRIQKVILSKESCVLTLSFNQPRFCSNDTWDIDAIHFANQSIAGLKPCAIFVNSHDSIYFANQETGEILIWENDKSIQPSKTISGSLSKPLSLFVTTNGDIYVDNGKNNRVDKWIAENNSWISVMTVPSQCYGLFVDIYHDFYCSMATQNKVDKKWSNGTITIVAGTGSAGLSADKLSGPCGVFVDTNQDLYVADFSNNRIQLFRLNQRNGVTVAGQGSVTATIDLVQPTGIALDGDRYLFIVDHGKHRLIGSNEYGFHCIFGCSASLGPTNDKLNLPASMSFDSYGNIYITDQYNNRIQKIVKKTTCGLSAIDPKTTTTENIQSTTGIPSTIEKRLSTSTRVSTDQTSISETESPAVLTDQTLLTSMRVLVVLTSMGLAESPAVSTDQTLVTSTRVSSISETRSSVSTISKITISSTVSMLTTTNSNNVENCLCPRVILIPESNTFETAYQYRRSQEFYILSTIKINCNKSLSTKKIWKIRNYSTIGSSDIDFDKKVSKSSSELFIPSNTLPYGIYQFELTVEMIEDESLVDSSSVYVEINPSGVTVNLVPLGTSVVTVGHQQNLTLNPGNYSKDLDGFEFNASDWNYKYFCRIYNSAEQFSSIESYLPNQFELSGIENSSLLIYPGSFQIDIKYEFLIEMSNRQNKSLVVNGFIIVEIKSGHRPMIVIGCVIESLCRSDEQFQKLNPTSQVALFSSCIHHCLNVTNVIWKTYRGRMNSTTKSIQWILFENFENLWFYGRNTTSLTATNDLFRSYSNETHWKFEVIYSFETVSSSSAVNFEINQPLSYGSCRIEQHIGTINTLFNVNCSNWKFKENIKEYSLHMSSRQIIAFSPISSFQVRLPIGFHVDLFVEIRDILNGITRFNLSSVIVQWEPMDLTEKSFSDLLSSGNQNTIGQVINSINDELNRRYNQFIDKSPPSLSISPLGSQINSLDHSSSINESQFLKEINHLANLREYFIKFLDELTITSANSFKLQSLSLVQLTSGINQLTQTSLLSSSNKFYQLTHQLQQWHNKLPYEDVQIIVTQLLQCASNILSATNGPLQRRMQVLENDLQITDDYELEPMNPSFQKKFANELNQKIDEMISLLTSALNFHLNVGQQNTINTPEIFMSLERMSIQSLSNRTIKLIENAQISIRINFSSNQTISLRSIVKPIAIYDNSLKTNLSRSISLSILDENGIEIPVQTNPSTPIEFIIPRDPNLVIRKMTEQNVTNNSMLFKYHKYNLHENYSIHFEFHSLNEELSYLVTYRFDSSMRNIVGWKYFCSKKQDEIFTVFLDNNQTSHHRTVTFAIRELNIEEEKNYCRNQTSNLLVVNSPMKFSSNYEIRSYVSACFYLDEQNQWQSDRLIVGPLTNHSQTHCLSTHI